jgi:uncharacterized protein (TIGR03437 family)
MIRQLSRWALVSLSSLLVSAASAATFGTAVSIGGHASDLALDEARGVVYVANFTANRIDVISTKTMKLCNAGVNDNCPLTSMAVAVQPSTLALSPDGRYLLVGHVSNFSSDVGTTHHSLTLINLVSGAKQTYAMGNPPLGVAFGNDGIALIVTTTDFMLFNPETKQMASIATIQEVTTREIPVVVGTFPPEITAASTTASGDGSKIFGMMEWGDSENQCVQFRYDTATKSIKVVYWTYSPPPGPRVIATDKTGSVVMAAWTLMHPGGYQLAQFPGASGAYSVGTSAIDGSRNTIYTQMSNEEQYLLWPSETAYKGPALMVADADNLAIREQLKLPESLMGRSLLNASGEVLYSVSSSGLMILPVARSGQAPRVAASQEMVVFKGSWCSHTPMSQEIQIVDPNGGATDFTLSSTLSGVTVSPSSGVTPARIQVTIDPAAFQNTKGTASGLIQISSSAAVNVPVPVKVLVNNREPDQRGTFLAVPGKLVDIVADTGRGRFYVLRQDKNQVLVFDANTQKQIATLRTGNTPWSMAMTTDQKYLLVGADNSQVAHAFDLDTLTLWKLIVMPGGHYPRSIAVSGNAILAACRSAGSTHTIDKINLWATPGSATTLPSLGVFKNDIDEDTALTSSPSGSSIFGVMPDGRTILYNANSNTFVAGRQDFEKLSGGFGAMGDSAFAVDNHLLNDSLVETRVLETGSGVSSGFALVDGMGMRTTAPNSSSPGVITKLDLTLPISTNPTRMAEAPALAGLTTTTTTETTIASSVFIRSLAALPSQGSIVSLSTSGITVLPWQYDAAVADPKIRSVTSAADGGAVAPGSLIAVQGTDLSPVNVVTSQIPLPTLLGDSCMTVNGQLVPMVLVSPTRINAQLPYGLTGPGTLILRTPAGVSNPFVFPIQTTAPGVFRADVEPYTDLMPVIVRAENNTIVTYSNPVHLDDWLTIYLTGLGATSPAVDAGNPGPSDPLAEAMVTPTVTLGGSNVPVYFAGLAPGQVGVYQINVKVPFAGVPLGWGVPLKITQGGYSTELNVRVVD